MLIPENLNSVTDSASLVEQANAVLATMPSHQQQLLRTLFATIQNEARYHRVADLWARHDVPLTYWVLLMTGVDQADEKSIAQELLSWHAFSAKASAKIQCIPSSDQEAFRLCSSMFGVVDFPTLILSNSADMESYVRLSPGLLFRLAEQDGALPRFFTKLQRILEMRDNIQDVKATLEAKAFWDGFQFAYKEIKEFFSISLQLGK